MRTLLLLTIFAAGYFCGTVGPSVSADSGWWYDSTGTQGVIVDQGGSGFYYDSTGRQGVYQGTAPLPFAAPKSPC